MQRDRNNWQFPAFVIMIYLFLYIPVAILMLFSFNKGDSSTYWLGFSTHWYSEVFSSGEVYDALSNSLIVGFSSVCLSVVLSTMYVFYGRLSGLYSFLPLFYIGLAVPEIVIAVGLLSMFYALSLPLGIMTLIAGHTLMGLGYVVPIIYARYNELDERLLEASYDLGATRIQTFFYIVVPFLLPALLSSALLVFIVSFDDFVLSFFCAGPSAQTLPVYLFALIRSGATPMVNVISTLMLVTSALSVGIFSWLQYGRQNK